VYIFSSKDSLSTHPQTYQEAHLISNLPHVLFNVRALLRHYDTRNFDISVSSFCPLFCHPRVIEHILASGPIYFSRSSLPSSPSIDLNSSSLHSQHPSRIYHTPHKLLFHFPTTSSLPSPNSKSPHSDIDPLKCLPKAQ